MKTPYKTGYKYIVSVDNENNEDWVNIYEGTDIEAAQNTYNHYVFIESDIRIHLTHYKMTWWYEWTETPEIDCVPNTLKERFN